MLLTHDTLVAALKDAGLDEVQVGRAADAVLVLMDMPDDPMNQMFPDEVHLSGRRKQFMAKVIEYTDPAKRVVSDGGWTPATWVDVQEFDALITELRDLRYGRDGDGDATIVWSLCPRTMGRLHTFFEPYAPEDNKTIVSPEKKAEYNETMTNLASRMIGLAEDFLRMQSFRIRQDQKDQQASRDREIDYGVFKGLVGRVPFDVSKAAYLAIIKKYRGHQSLYELRDALAATVDPFLVTTAQTIDRLIDEGRLDEAKDMMDSTFKAWFGGVLKAQRNRWNEAQATIRKAAKAAGEKPTASSGQYIHPDIVDEV
jgi:hypothetical protein